MTENAYPDGEKRIVRAIDKPIAWLEGQINRLTTEKYNPLYHLGTLAIFLLLVLTATGIYLTALYRPGTAAAYQSVELISSSWFGQLMRSMHRFASDAFMVVSLLHALKSFSSGRFWGARTVAWISGWVIVILTWITGLLGFWMVWDQRAQWITQAFIDMMKGAVAVTFLSTDLASSTFSSFIIAEFLHVFLPLAFALLLFLHILRLARSRLLSPRWMMVYSTLALVLVSLVLPFRSAPPANLDSVVQPVPIDSLYLGFLVPFQRWGSGPATLIGGLILLAIIALPWLARGKHPGPAVVTGVKCTGCSICSVECPYKAIEMLQREEQAPDGSKRMARVYPNLCTGCGICVGTCATMGIELEHLPTAKVYREGLLARVQRQKAAGVSPAVVVTCQRQVAAGTLAQYLNKDGSDRSAQVLTCVLPCTGMVDAAWTRELFAAGARDIAFVSCPYDDCANREGPQWLYTRFKRHKSVLVPGVHWLETAPGLKTPITHLMNNLAHGEAKPTPPEVKERGKAWPRLRAALTALVVLTVLSLPIDFVAGPQVSGKGDVRIVLEHHGIVKNEQTISGVKLPENAVVDNTKILGGERYPVQISVSVDGQTALTTNYNPTGWRKEGMISGFDKLTLPSGEHTIEIKIKDDNGEARSVFTSTLNIQPAAVYTIVYNRDQDKFSLR